TSIEPAVILTDSDPAVNSAVKEVFKSTYPIYCAFHITQNLYKNLRKSLDTQYNQFFMDFYKCQNSLVKTIFENKFTKLGHDYPKAKPYLDNLYKSKDSNMSLNELMQEIHHMLDCQDKESKYLFWKLVIPSIKSNDQANFLFTYIDKCCQTYLTPNMLKMQRDEINQLVYYSAQIISIESLKSINEDNIMINIEEENPEDQHATIQQMLEVVGEKNIVEACEEAPDYNIPYLFPFYNQEKDFLQENLSLLKQKLLLEDFVQECDQSEDSSSDDNYSDESTSEREFQLKNPK
ncbi:9924_t:CDS:2, partial [Dentiscutata heterogama]